MIPRKKAEALNKEKDILEGISKDNKMLGKTDDPEETEAPDNEEKDVAEKDADDQVDAVTHDKEKNNTGGICKHYNILGSIYENNPEDTADKVDIPPKDDTVENKTEELDDGERRTD